MNDTAEAFLASIDNNDSEIAPSSIYAAACILEGVPFINGSPQNTFVPGLIELAVEKGDLSPTQIFPPNGPMYERNEMALVNGSWEDDEPAQVSNQCKELSVAIPVLLGA